MRKSKTRKESRKFVNKNEEIIFNREIRKCLNALMAEQR